MGYREQQAKRVVLSFVGKTAKDAEIPVGLSDQQVKMFSAWSRPNGNPHIKAINGNFKSNPKGDPFKGLTKEDKEDLLAWTVFKVQNPAKKPADADTTESASELLESEGDMFKSQKDLDRHLAKQLSRVPDSGLSVGLSIQDNGKVKFEEKSK